MLPRLVIVVLFFPLVTIIHLVGLFLLQKSNDMNIYGTQKYLIVALSLTEVSFLPISAIRECIYHVFYLRHNIGLCLENYMAIVLTNMYYLIMFCITIDRVLEIRLNIRYHLYWNGRKTKKMLQFIFLILNILYIIYLALLFTKQLSSLSLQVFAYYYIYVAPVFDGLFVITAVTSYSYIFAKIYRNSKRQERLRRRISGKKTSRYPKSVLARFLVPFWIIITFILFLVVPDIMHFIDFTYKLPENIMIATLILYRIGYIADPIIYIYNLEIVKNRMKRMRRSIAEFF